MLAYLTLVARALDAHNVDARVHRCQSLLELSRQSGDPSVAFNVAFCPDEERLRDELLVLGSRPTTGYGHRSGSHASAPVSPAPTQLAWRAARTLRRHHARLAYAAGLAAAPADRSGPPLKPDRTSKKPCLLWYMLCCQNSAGRGDIQQITQTLKNLVPTAYGGTA